MLLRCLKEQFLQKQLGNIFELKLLNYQKYGENKGLKDVAREV